MKFLFKTMTFIGITVVSFTALSGSAFAQANQTANTWAGFNMTMHYSGNAYTKERRATIDTGEVVHTTSDTSSGLMFSCLEGRFMVGISWKPQDFRAKFGETSKRRRGKNIDMRLDDGEKKKLGLWVYKPALGTASSRKRWQAAKLYNAVVRQQSVTLYMHGKKSITLDLPKPNKAFAEFGAKCGIGKFAKKK